jgi:hypothetical protein
MSEEAPKPKKRRGRPPKLEKPSIVCVPTVPHTGSKFVAKHLLQDFRELNPRRDTGAGVYWAHVWPDMRPYWDEVLTKGPVIVPMRKPRDIMLSHARRGRPLEDVLFLFDNLVEWVLPHDPLFLPIDAQDRDQWLADINKATGLDLKTEWPRVGSIGIAKAKVNEAKVNKFAAELTERHADLLSRFYDLP